MPEQRIANAASYAPGLSTAEAEWILSGLAARFKSPDPAFGLDDAMAVGRIAMALKPYQPQLTKAPARVYYRTVAAYAIVDALRSLIDLRREAVRARLAAGTVELDDPERFTDHLMPWAEPTAERELDAVIVLDAVERLSEREREAVMTLYRDERLHECGQRLRVTPQHVYRLRKDGIGRVRKRLALIQLAPEVADHA